MIHLISINTFKNWTDILLVKIYIPSSKEEGGYKKKLESLGHENHNKNNP